MAIDHISLMRIKATNTKTQTEVTITGYHKLKNLKISKTTKSHLQSYNSFILLIKIKYTVVHVNLTTIPNLTNQYTANSSTGFIFSSLLM